MLIHPGPLVKSKKAEAAQVSPTASFPVRITPGLHDWYNRRWNFPFHSK